MDRDGWSPLRAYGRSKLCNILFTRALARRLADSGVVAASLHPGVIATKIGDSAGSVAGFGWRLAKPFFASPEKGARTTLFLATTADPSPISRRLPDRQQACRARPRRARRRYGRASLGRKRPPRRPVTASIGCRPGQGFIRGGRRISIAATIDQVRSANRRRSVRGRGNPAIDAEDAYFGIAQPGRSQRTPQINSARRHISQRWKVRQSSRRL